jgi:ABC-type oligopeptide transport system substrate-binding subunit
MLQAEIVFMKGLPVAPLYNRANCFLNKPYVTGLNRHPFFGTDYRDVKILKH